MCVCDRHQDFSGLLPPHCHLCPGVQLLISELFLPEFYRSLSPEVQKESFICSQVLWSVRALLPHLRRKKFHVCVCNQRVANICKPTVFQKCKMQHLRVENITPAIENRFPILFSLAKPYECNMPHEVNRITEAICLFK